MALCEMMHIFLRNITEQSSEDRPLVICLHKAASGISICSWVRVFIAGEGFRCGQNFVAGAGFRCGQEFCRDRFSMRTGAGSNSMRTGFSQGQVFDADRILPWGQGIDADRILSRGQGFDADRIFVLVRLPRFDCDARFLFLLCTLWSHC